MKKERTPRQPKVWEALLALIFVIAVVVAAIRTKVGIQMGLAMGGCTAIVFALLMGNKWSDIQDTVKRVVGDSATTLLILLSVGMMVGIWIIGGTVPTLLYYGLKICSPNIIVPLAFVLCAITSLFTGTSFGSIATMGLALFGVGTSMGISAPLMAGAVCSGAFFGDKMSPLSDTTLLASATSGVKLFDHITSLLFVTVPASLISIVVYGLLGMRYASGDVDLSAVKVLSDSLLGSCHVSVLMLVPLLFVLVLSAMRKPTIPVFAGGLVIGCIWAMVFQGASLNDVISAAINGFVSATGNADVDKLLSRGGALSMAETIFLCIGAGMFSGIFERTGVLHRLMDSLCKVVKSVGGLVLSLTVTGIVLMFGGAGQSCTLSLPAIAFRNAFDDMDVNPCVMSRTLECTGTVLGSIVPWDASAILYTGLFGVSVAQYLPFNLIALLSPILAVVTAFIGFGVFKSNETVHFTLKCKKYDKQTGKPL